MKGISDAEELEKPALVEHAPRAPSVLIARNFGTVGSFILFYNKSVKRVGLAVLGNVEVEIES
jgi:hypothetical protein